MKTAFILAVAVLAVVQEVSLAGHIKEDEEAFSQSLDVPEAPSTCKEEGFFRCGLAKSIGLSTHPVRCYSFFTYYCCPDDSWIACDQDAAEQQAMLDRQKVDLQFATQREEERKQAAQARWGKVRNTIAGTSAFSKAGKARAAKAAAQANWGKAQNTIAGANAFNKAGGARQARVADEDARVAARWEAAWDADADEEEDAEAFNAAGERDMMDEDLSDPEEEEEEETRALKCANAVSDGVPRKGRFSGSMSGKKCKCMRGQRLGGGDPSICKGSKFKASDASAAGCQCIGSPDRCHLDDCDPQDIKWWDVATKAGCSLKCNRLGCHFDSEEGCEDVDLSD